MQFRKIMKVALDNPFFEYRGKYISRLETERIFYQDFPSFATMINSAKERFHLPKEEWDIYDEVISERAVRRRYGVGLSSLIHSWSHFLSNHRRLAVSYLILILMLLFFSVLPSGRVMARNLFNMIVKVFDDRIELRSSNPSYDDHNIDDLFTPPSDTEIKEGNDASEPIYYDNIQAFTDEIGFVPVVLEADWLTLQEIYSINDEDIGLMLMTKYQTKDDLFIYVTQSWGPEIDHLASTKGDKIKKTNILDGKEFYYATDSIDSIFYGTAVLNDSILFIGAEQGVDGKVLIEVLEDK